QAATSQLSAAGESEGEALKQFSDFSKHQATQIASSHGDAVSISAQENRSFTKLQNSIESFAQDHGISTEKSLRLFGSVLGSLGFGSFARGSIGGEIGWSSVDRDLYAAAKSYSEQHGLQTAWQESKQALKETRSTVSDDQGKRYADGIQAALDRATHLRQEASANLQHAESFTQSAAHTQQHAASISANVSQSYVQWLAQQPLPNSSGPMGQQEAEQILSARPDMDLLYQRRFLETELSPKIQRGYGSLPHSSQEVMERYSAQEKETATSTFSPASSQDWTAEVHQKALQEGVGEAFKSSIDMQKTTGEEIARMRDAIQKSEKDIQQQGAQHRIHLQQEAPGLKKQLGDKPHA
ncbi:MAG: hypothetical protein ACRCYZ_02215, partial [Alphaproteobacteria bacterium]